MIVWRRGILAVLFLSLVFGCGSVFAAGSHQQTGTASGNVTLQMWWPAPESSMAQAAKAFVDQSNTSTSVPYKMKLTVVPWSDYFTKLNATFAAGDAPDLFGTGFGQMGAIAATGNLYPLTKMLDGWSQFKDFFTAYQTVGTYDGQTYALLLPEVRPLIYRADLFRAAGLNPDHAPTSMAEVREYAKKLVQYNKDGSINISGFAYGSAAPEQMAVTLGSQFGSSYLWDKAGHLIVDKGMIEGIRFLQDLIYKDKVTDPNLAKIPGGPMVNGRAAMTMFESSWNIGLLVDKWGNDVRIALPPEKSTLTLGIFVAAARGTKHPEQAMDAYRRFFSVDNLWRMAKVNFIPTRVSMMKQFAGQSSRNAVLAQTLDHAYSYRNTGQFFNIMQIVPAALQKIWLTDADPVTTMDAARSQLAQLQ